MKKASNFQDEFSIQDIEVAIVVRSTYDFSISKTETNKHMRIWNKYTKDLE